MAANHNSLPVLMLIEVILPLKDTSGSKRQKEQQREAPAAAAHSAEPLKQPDSRAAALAAALATVPSTAEASISTRDGLTSLPMERVITLVQSCHLSQRVPILKLLPQRLTCSVL